VIDKGLLDPSLSPSTVYDTVYQSLESTDEQTKMQWSASPARKSVLGLSLSLHSMAPSVEAYYHYYNEVIVSSFNQTKFDTRCGVWVDFFGKQYCNPSNVEADLEGFDVGYV
jgi:hypothetical protein